MIHDPPYGRILVDNHLGTLSPIEYGKRVHEALEKFLRTFPEFQDYFSKLQREALKESSHHEFVSLYDLHAQLPPVQGKARPRRKAKPPSKAPR